MLVALLLQPVHAAANIHHRLAAGGQRPADVGAHRVVRSLQFRGTPDIVVGHGEPQRRNPHPVEDRAQRIVAETVGIPLRQHHDGLLGPLGVFMLRCRVPAGVHLVVLRVRRPLRRGKTQKLRRRNLSLGCHLADRGILGQCLRAHIGGEQLRMPFFQPEVGGPLVPEEAIAVADEELVDADHGRFSRRIVAHNLRVRHRVPKAVSLKKRRDPIEAPLHAGAPPGFRHAWSAASPTRTSSAHIFP